MSYSGTEEINNIRLNADIVEIISGYISLTQKGKNFFCVCPFHNDHSPSMSVSKDKQIYKCFSCGASGNVFTFVQEYENVSFSEAVNIIAAKIGMATIHNTYQSRTKQKFKEEYELHELCQKFYQNNLNTELGKDAKVYLNNRGITDDVIKEFGIGLALNKTDSLYNLLKQKGYDKKKLYDLGLININEKRIFDVFTNRVVFPLHDSDGNIVAFNGRIYNSSTSAKYVNTKETYIFKKGQILYNYHRAKDYAKRAKQIVIVEGNLDAIRLFENGVQNVIALMGTSFTTDQLQLIKKLRVSVVLCLDNDSAGLQATYTIGEALTKDNIDVSVIRLSEHKDPDEYIVKKGIEAFQENLKKPINFFEFKLSYLKEQKNLNNMEELAEYINEVIENLNTIEDDILKDLTITKISKEYDISVEVLKNKLSQKPKTNIEANTDYKPKEKIKKVNTKYHEAAENLLYYMMNDPIYIRIYLKKLGFFPERNHRDIANEIVYYYEKNKNINIADFISFVGSKEKILADVTDIISNIKTEELNEYIFEEYIIAIKKIINLNEINKIKNEMKKELDVHRKLELANKIVELKKEV